MLALCVGGVHVPSSQPVASLRGRVTAAAFAATATLVSLGFGLSTLDRWLERRRDHELAWTVALLLFAAGALALWAGVATGWTGPIFRVFYLCGAILNVVTLAFGTLLLLVGSARVRPWTWVLIAFCGFASGVVLAAPFEAAVPSEGLPTGRELFGPLPRILASVASIGGAAVLVGGAGWTVIRLLGRGPDRTASDTRLMWANVMIAVGVLILGLGGAAFEEPTPFAATTGIGIAVVFAGFLLTNPSHPPHPPHPRHARRAQAPPSA